jgi:hypothetical protein
MDRWIGDRWTDDEKVHRSQVAMSRMRMHHLVDDCGQALYLLVQEDVERYREPAQLVNLDFVLLFDVDLFRDGRGILLWSCMVIAKKYVVIVICGYSRVRKG